MSAHVRRAKGARKLHEMHDLHGVFDRGERKRLYEMHDVHGPFASAA